MLGDLGAPVPSGSLFMIDGQLNLGALSTSADGACASVPSLDVTGLVETPPAPVTQGQPFMATLNADGIGVERLALAENEQAAGGGEPTVGFLPFPDRFSVEGDTLYMLAYSVTKGYELAEATAQGGVKVHNFNPAGDSFAGFPSYDDRSIKGFDGKLFFYALGADGQFEFSSLKGGSALQGLDADPAGSDIRLVRDDFDPVEPGPGVIDREDIPFVYRSSHIQSLRVLREKLMSAASLAQPVIDTTTGEVIQGAVNHDIEPQRVGAGKKPVAEIVDLYPEGNSLPRNMAEFNGAVYMIAKVDGGFPPCADGRDYELVRLEDDGNSSVVEINADGWAFFPSTGYPELTVYNGDLYLVANVDDSDAGRHELVKITPAHEVSVVPLNPDGAAFPDADQLRNFWTGPDIPATFTHYNGDLVVFGARTGGTCFPPPPWGGPPCDDPYEYEVVRIDAGGTATVIDMTPGPGTTFDTFLAEFLPPTFTASEFDGDLYFNCLGCNDWSLYRLNADGTHTNFSDWAVVPTTADNRNFTMGVQRGDAYYLSGFNFVAGDEGVLKIGGDGSFGVLTSPDMGYGFLNNLTVFGDLILASADIFTSPAKDFENDYLGTELLVVHPDDSLGYVDVRPGLDMYDWPLSSWPQSFRVAGNTLFFSSYGDPTFTSELHDLYRVTLPPERARPDDDLR